MSTRSIELPEHLDRFIDDAVRSGRGSDASGLVREGLELLERQEAEDRAKLDWLGNAVAEGINSVERGEFTTLETRREIKEFVAAISAKRRSIAK